MTGGENGTLFRAQYDAAAPLQALTSAAKIGEHVLGTAVKAISTTPLAGSPGG